MTARIDGIDLSNIGQGSRNIDFVAAAKAGVKFAYHKATESTGFHDPSYATRRAQINAAGIRFGAYHFARPASSGGTEQARYFLAFAKPAKGDMRPMLDLEDRGGMTQVQLTRWVKNFVAEVVKQTGAPPFIYTQFDLNANFDCPLWTSRYSNGPVNGDPVRDGMAAPRIPAPWKNDTIWQFSDGKYGHPNSVPGVGHCDLNTINGDPAKIVAAFTLGHKDAPAPAPAPEPRVVVPPVSTPATVTRGAKIDHAIADLAGSPRWRAKAARRLLLAIPPIKSPSSSLPKG